MALEGLHHITAITADAPRNVDFYARVLGLRLVKKTVNFDQPDVYHLYFGDERGTPGLDPDLLRVPRRARWARPATAWSTRSSGASASDEALDFWAARLADAGVATERTEDGALALRRPRGPAPRAARRRRRRRAAGRRTRRDIPAEHALLGFHGVRAYAARPDAQHRAAARRSASPHDGGADWTLRGDERRAALRYDAAAARRAASPSAGTVHHVAWSAADDAELEAVRAQAVARPARARPTIIDRQYFHSVYFREPSGVLFELASRDIGFDVRRAARVARRGAASCRRSTRRCREQLEQALTPLTNPRVEDDGMTELVHAIRPAAGEPAGRARAHARARRRRARPRALPRPARPAAAARRRHARRAAVPAAGRPPLVRRCRASASPTPTPSAPPTSSCSATSRSSPACRGSARSSAASRRAPSWPTPSGSAPGARRPAGIVAMSGFIPTVEGWSADLDRPGPAGVDRPRAARPGHRRRVRRRRRATR